MAMLDPPLAEAGLDCPGRWVTLSCTGEHARHEDARRMFDQMRDAFAREAPVEVRVTDDTKHDGHCRATRLRFEVPLEADRDSDGDGVADLDDDLPLDPSETVDTDDDGVGNHTDTDDDGDGIADADDPLPLIPFIDTDGDGIGDDLDADDDGDGVPDLADAFPLDGTEFADSDGDGVGDRADPDDDNDGIAEDFYTGRSYGVIVSGRGRLYVATSSRLIAYDASGHRNQDFDILRRGWHGSVGGAAFANGELAVATETSSGPRDYNYYWTITGAVSGRLDDDQSAPTGLAIADGRGYVTLRGHGDTGNVRAFYQGHRYPPADFRLDPANRHPQDIDFVNGTFYVADDGKLYAYDASGLRKPSLDFRVYGGQDVAFAAGGVYVYDGTWVRRVTPDYVVEAPSVSLAVADPGQTLEVSAIVRNRSPAHAPDTSLRYYFSTDVVIDEEDLQLGSGAVPASAPFEGTQVSTTLTAPPEPGCYFCAVCVDPADTERITDNNCSVPVEVVVGDPQSGLEPCADRDFPLAPDNGRPADIAFVNDRLFVLDRPRRGEVYAYHSNGVRDTSSDFDLARKAGGPDEDGIDRMEARGITFARGRFHVLSFGYSTVHIHAYRMDGRRDPASDHSTGHRTHGLLKGLTFDGERFLSVDTTHRKVLSFGTADGGAQTSEFDLAEENASPASITFIDSRLYVVDADASRAFAYRANGERQPGFDIALEAGPTQTAGIVFGNGRFYIVDSSEQRVRVIRARRNVPALQNRDSDADGVVDVRDDFPMDPSETRDTDGDGIGDDADLDDDNDTIPDSDDLFPLDPHESADSDADGVGNAADPDDDNDGIEDAVDETPYSILRFAASVDAVAFASGRYYGIVRTDDPDDIYLDNRHDEFGKGKALAFLPSGRRDSARDFQLDPANGSPTDIAFVNGRLLVLDRDRTVYAYRLSGARDPDSDFSLAARYSSLVPTGIVFAEGKFHVAFARTGRHWPGRVYAYDESGERQPASDFDLGEENKNPIGIGWIGGRFYVADGPYYARWSYAYTPQGERDPDFDVDLGNERFANGPHGLYLFSRGYAFTPEPRLSIPSAQVPDTTRAPVGSSTSSPPSEIGHSPPRRRSASTTTPGSPNGSRTEPDTTLGVHSWPQAHHSLPCNRSASATTPQH